MRTNNLILQTVTRIVIFIIMTFAFFLFISGHNNPGGGFAGGMTTAAALVLLYLAYDVKTVHEGIPIDFKTLSLLGVFIAVATGASSLVMGKPFLNQSFGYYTLPLLGETELTTALLFDTGVAMAVVGMALTIIDAISKDISEDNCPWKP